MKKNYIVGFVIVASSVALSFFLINSSALAQTGLEDIKYPISELGNCKNEAGCRSYCDESQNTEACLNFAEKNNLIPQEEIEAGRKFSKIGKGPGGCTGKDSCDSYCQNIDHMDECVAFAEQNDLIPEKDLSEMKKVQAAIKKGVKAPACKTKKDCDVFCGNPENMEVCMNFALEAGLMSEQEQKESKQVLAAIKKGIKPPACGGKEQCDTYCSDESHFDECILFAEAAGFVSGKDLEMAKKTKGKGPGGCRGKEACESFCQKEGNMDVCIKFGEENGFMTKEEAEMARKTGGKGPGGCNSKESCDTFCNTPENQETCFEFGKANGMIPQDQLQEIEKGKQGFKETMSQMPQEVSDCLASSLGADTVEKFKSGAAMPSREIGEKMRECFEKNMKQRGPGGPGEGGNMPPGVGGGGANIPSGMQAGPGGCTSPEECQKVCTENPDICKNFGPSSSDGSGSGEMRERGQFREGIQSERMMSPDGGYVPGGEGGQYGPPPGTEYAPGTMPPGNFVPPQKMMPREGENGVPQEIPNYEGQYAPPQGDTFRVEQMQNIPLQNFVPPSDQYSPPPGYEGTVPSTEAPSGPAPESFTPPPEESTQPPPSTSINPNSLLGKVLNILGNY